LALALHWSDASVKHHFTVDVEEYFHASALEPFCPPPGWDGLERRSVPVMDRLLDLLAARQVTATFFVLGWLARREPRLVRRIAAEGHEVASHGWDHRRVTHQSPREFRASVRDSRRLLEDQSGGVVLGFRAPSFSIVPGREWALDILLEEGYRYDSSLFPVSQHPDYGYPCPRDPHWIRRPAGMLAEVPPTTLRVAGSNLPAAGGAYFRFLPYRFIQAAFRDSGRRGVPGTFYIHPWEFDPELPNVGAPGLTRLRMTGGNRRNWDRVGRFLGEFRFDTVARTVASLPVSQPMPEGS